MSSSVIPGPPTDYVGASRPSGESSLVAAVRDRGGFWGTRIRSRGMRGASPAKTLVGVLAVLVTTSVGAGAPAEADSGADFLALVSKTGINVGDSPADITLTLAAGMLVCRLIIHGYPTEVAIREMGYSFPDASRAQLAGFVDAAQAKLCEPNFAPLNLGGY